RGQVATVTAEGAPASRLGTVHAVSPAVDSVTNAGRVVVRLANAQGVLRVGAGATAVIDLESRPGVLAVPEGAPRPGEDGLSVLVVRADSTVEKRPVRVGIHDGGWVEVAGDLRAGERVVTLGGYGLDTNMRVRVQDGHSP